MKKIICTVLGFILVGSMTAQQVEEVRKDIYYERFETAKSKLLTTVNSGTPNPDAIYWLGEIYLQQGKLDSAAMLYREKATAYLQKDFNKKESPLLYAGWAHVLLDSGNTAAAKEQMEMILDKTKRKNATALWAVAKANIDSKNGDIKYAIELLNRAIERDKKNPELYNTLGDAYRKIVDGSNAIRNYNMALEYDPRNTEAMYKSGKIYKTQNNPDVYLEKFKEAYAFDSTYTPVLYEMYQYYFTRDVYYANIYLNKYLANAEFEPQQAYMKADLNYISKKYAEAISEGEQILNRDKDSAQARIYKLIAYSQAALGDSAKALARLTQYFNKEDTANLVARDFFLKAQLMEKSGADTAMIVATYTEALNRDSVAENKAEYLNSLVNLADAAGNTEDEAMWREQLYNTKTSPTNLDLYKWGLALYQNKSFEKADSVFAIYEEKYPDQVYGPLYRARANTFIDSTMEQGLAVPHYKKLIEVAGKDEAKNKSLLLLAYEYLGAYEANVTKQYAASIEYFDKLLSLDPGNENAERNTALLKKWIDAEEKNN